MSLQAIKLILQHEGFQMKQLQSVIDNVNGKVGVPILLYFLGVPGFAVILLWAFFFRGK